MFLILKGRCYVFIGGRMFQGIEYTGTYGNWVYEGEQTILQLNGLDTYFDNQTLPNKINVINSCISESGPM